MKKADARSVLTVIAVSSILGWLVIFQWTSNESFKNSFGAAWMDSAVMYAAGYGIAPDPGNSPIRDFLAFERPYLAKADVPPPTATVLSPFTRAHRLLLLTFGLAWRIFGISHTVAKAVLLCFFVWTALITYALCRLAMRPMLAAAVSLLYLFSCPQLLICVASPRDFCKAPIALTLVYLIALLIAKRSSPRRFLILSVLLGIAGGFATGFRQDLFIYLPPAVGAICCCRLTSRLKQTLILKGVAVVLFLLCLIPFSRSTVKASTDDVFTFHYLVMGWSRRCDASLGIGQASYAILDNYLDLYAAVAYQRYGALLDAAGKPPRNQTWTEASHDMKSFITKVVASFKPPDKTPENALKYFGFKDSARDARRLWLKIVTTLPADVLTRAYASVLQILSYDSDAPRYALSSRDPGIDWSLRVRALLVSHFRHCGLLYAVAALLLVAYADVPLAVIATCLLLYLCGYTSLQFLERHIFHLFIIPLGLAGFVIDAALRALPALRQASGRANARLWFSDFLHGKDRKLQTLALCLATLAFFLFAPLFAARLYQRGQVADIIKNYQAVEWEPLVLGAECTPQNGSPYIPIQGIDNLPLLENVSPYLDTTYEVSYVAADISGLKPASYASPQYAASHSEVDFSAPLDVGGQVRADQPVRAYFPIYEIRTPKGSLSRFLGFRPLPGLQAAYRARTPEKLQLPFSLVLPSNPEEIRYHQSLGRLFFGAAG